MNLKIDAISETLVSGTELAEASKQGEAINSLLGKQSLTTCRKNVQNNVANELVL